MTKANKFTHKVLPNQMAMAIHNWHAIMNKPVRYHASPHKFFGTKDIDWKSWYGDLGIPCTELAYNKIMMLQGPHARTMLKAFAARTGYQKPIP